MVILRLLLIALLVWLAWSYWRKLTAPRTGRSTKPAAEQNNAERHNNERGNERLLRCEHCDTHFPATQAVTVANRHYCSLPHAQAAEAAGSE